jgi:TPR repeat protein
MSESEKQTALVPTQPNALTKRGAKSLVVRGHIDLRNNEEAEAWLKKGLDFYNGGGIGETNAEVRKKRYEEAFACFEHGIQLNANQTEIQNMLGHMYAYGHGTSHDRTQAVSWYRKAAVQEYAEAQYNLGGMYYKGYGVHQDKAQAVSWFRMAAEQGHAKAQFNLGVIYDNGYGVPQDKNQAEYWYSKAAEQGVTEAPIRQAWRRHAG